MAVSNSDILKRTRSLAKKLPFIQTIYRKAYRKAQHHNLMILEKIPEFVPNSAVSSNKIRVALTLQSVHQTFPFLRSLLQETGNEIIQIIDAQAFSLREQGIDSAYTIKDFFDSHGSDKASVHDYHFVYGPILSKPGDIRSILEIGLGTNNEDVPSHMGHQGKPGASLRAFRDYLPHAQVFGADIDKRILFEEERIKTFFVDQTDIETVYALSKQLPENIDLIIDDGLHAPSANISILILAANKLKIGGWVVIEDISHFALPFWQVIAFMMHKNFEISIINGRGGLLFAAKRLV